MHLRVLQRSRQAVCADEMFFRNEKPRAGAGFPLCRMLELLRCAIECEALFLRDGCGVTRRLPNSMALHQMQTAEMKRKTAAAITATRS